MSAILPEGKHEFSGIEPFQYQDEYIDTNQVKTCGLEYLSSQGSEEHYSYFDADMLIWTDDELRKYVDQLKKYKEEKRAREEIEKARKKEEEERRELERLKAKYEK